MRDCRNCALVEPARKDSSSFHRNAELECDDLINQGQQIVQRFERHNSE